MKVINLTPHAVKIVRDGNVVLEIPSSGVARARQQDVPAGEIEVDGVTISVVKTEFGETEDLPEPAEGVGYVVSIITANAAEAQGRNCSDLYLSSGLVRNEEGQIIGCERLARFR